MKTEQIPRLYSSAKDLMEHTEKELSKGERAPRKPMTTRLDVAIDKMRHNIVPELSVSIIAEAYDKTAAERDRLREQRNELLAALKTAELYVAIYNRDHFNRASQEIDAKTIRAAIRSAEGRSNE